MMADLGVRQKSRSPWWRIPGMLLVTLALSGCFRLMQSEGGGEARFNPPRQVDPTDIALMEGYRIEAVARDLTFPSGITFDDQGRVYITESGYSYGDYRGTPRLLRIESNGSATVIAEGRNPPWNGVEYHDGAFYVAGGHLEPGQLLRITPNGQIQVLVDGLPSLGDHFPSGPVLGPDGWLYFGVGTATNSGVVGHGNFLFGWPHRYPEFHDVPVQGHHPCGQELRHAQLAHAGAERYGRDRYLRAFRCPREGGAGDPGRVSV